MRGRGSKLCRLLRRLLLPKVAPRAGAWIETSITTPCRCRFSSPPVRGRGSKLQHVAGRDRLPMSPPVRGRGSKLREAARRLSVQGRPPCGGVDRNDRDAAYALDPKRRPPCGGVDRNDMTRAIASLRGVAPRAGAWIETQGHHLAQAESNGRPPCGGVDRNQYPIVIDQRRRVAPRAGAWIETFVFRNVPWQAGSPPVRGRGSKPETGRACASKTRRPPCGGVDRNIFGGFASNNGERRMLVIVLWRRRSAHLHQSRPAIAADCAPWRDILRHDCTNCADCRAGCLGRELLIEGPIRRSVVGFGDPLTCSPKNSHSNRMKKRRAHHVVEHYLRAPL